MKWRDEALRVEGGAHASEGHTRHISDGRDAEEAPSARSQEHWIHHISHVFLGWKSREFKVKKRLLDMKSQQLKGI